MCRRGVVGSSEEELDAEVAVLDGFLAPAGSPAAIRRQRFFLASSAGGVYAGSSGAALHRAHRAGPISPYGRAKLRSEEIATASPYAPDGAARWAGSPTSTGRARTSPSRRGSISQLCRAHLTRQPLSVYVSLDTMRDYLFVDDAAAMTVAGLGAVTDSGRRALKVLASERSTTVGAVLGDLHRITRRRPPVVLGRLASSRYQVRDLRLRSVAWPRTSAFARTPMVSGIAATLASLRRSP